MPKPTNSSNLPTPDSRGARNPHDSRNPSRDPLLCRAAESLAVYGPHGLSDVELLALGARAPSLDAAACALRTLTLAELATATERELRQALSLSTARARQLRCLMEIGRRAAGAAPKRGQHLARAADVFRLMAPLAHLAHEEFWSLALDAKHRLISAYRVGQGSATACMVAPRETFREAIRVGAVALIGVHNHPSGDPTPSPEDLALTCRLKACGDTLGVKLLDHVIVGGEKFVALEADRAWCRS